MGRLARLWSLSRREKWLFFEASVLLLLSITFVRAIAFKHIDKFLRARWNDGAQSDNQPEQEIKVLRHSVLRAVNALPCKSLCLSRSIVEFVMLRRRGIPAVIKVGARFASPSCLEAHAWIDIGPSSVNSEFTTVRRIGAPND